MKRKITFLIAALCAVMLITQPVKVVGQTRAEVSCKSLTFPDDNSSNNHCSNYTTEWTAKSGTFEWSIDKFNNNNWSNSWAYIKCGPKNSTSSATITTKSAIDKAITKVELTVSNIANGTVTAAKLEVSTVSNFASIAETVNASSITIASTGTWSFEITAPTANCYYRLTITTNNTTPKTNGVATITKVECFYNAYTITYNANGATGGTVPTATTHDAGSNATVASNTGSLVRTGYNFNGWNTQADGLGTDYAEGDPINSIAQDYTLYAKWTSASSPNIVVSGSGISSNALNLAHTASVDQTATASFNNMTGYTSPEVALYNDLACTEAFTGDWFSASLSGSTITYNASANAGAARTVYMRVSAVYSETTYYSNVITITQNALPCTVTYNANGGSGSMTDSDSPYDYNSTVTVLANGFTAPSGKHFYKWNTAPDGSGTYYVEDDTFTITGNVILYAQWEDDPIYVHITSLDHIIPGAHYILARGITKDATTQVMDGKQDDYRDAKTTTTNVQKGDVDGDGNDDIYIQEAGLYEFIVSGDEIVTISSVDYNSYTIYDKNNSGYLNNGLNLNTSTLNNSSRWILEFDEANNYQIKIRNVNTTGNYMQFNKTLPRVKTYGGTQDNGYLYIKYNDKDCEIYSATTLSQNESYTNLKIVKGTYVNGSVTVPDNKTLNVSGTLTNNGTAANLVINDGGQLITNSSIPLTYKKQITSAAKDGGWYTISTPVHTASNSFLEHESVENLILASESNYDFFRYDEASYTWINYKQGAFNLNIGQGYLYRNNGAELHFAGYNNQATSYNVALSYASTEDKLLGFNLIGNPYPQNITMSDVTVNNEGTLSGGYVLSESGAWSADVAATIAPAQGFLVQIDKTGVTATITKPTGGSKSRANNDYIKFIVANSQHEDAAFALFEEGYGLNKIDHRNSDIPMLYIPKEGHNFAIATMDDNTQSFNLNLKAKTTGKYTLTYKATGNYSYLHVIDRLTGEDVDMLMEGEYSFIASPSDAENRFIVRLEYSNGYENSEDSIFAYQSGSDIIVNGEGELQIFDVMGRRISTQYVSGVETINLQSHGVYIFKLNEKTQKIVVR